MNDKNRSSGQSNNGSSSDFDEIDIRRNKRPLKNSAKHDISDMYQFGSQEQKARSTEKKAKISSENIKQEKEKERQNNKAKEAGTDLKQGKKKKKKHRFLIFLLILVVVLALIYKLFFVTSNVTVSGDTSYSAEQLMEAAGITEKTNLFSFRASTAVSKIQFQYPDISSVTVSRTPPNSLEFTVTQGDSEYFIDIYGTYYYISDGLIVMSRTDYDTAHGNGTTVLKIPEIKRAVTGESLVMDDTTYEYVSGILTSVRDSTLRDRISMIDITDEFDIVMNVDSKYKLDFGDDSDIDMKLKLAAAVLEDEMFQSDSEATLDLTSLDETGVVIDNTLVLE